MQDLLNKREQIKNILDRAWKQNVQVSFPISSQHNDDSHFEILRSLEDENFSEIIICVTSLGVELPPPAFHFECFNFLMRLISEMEQVVGCRVGYVDKGGLEEYYSKTYRHRFGEL